MGVADDFERVRPELVAAARGPFAAVCESHGVGVFLAVWEAWAVMRQLQLALRVPGNDGEVAVVGRWVAELIEEQLAPAGPLRVLADLGWTGGHGGLVDGC